MYWGGGGGLPTIPSTSITNIVTFGDMLWTVRAHFTDSVLPPHVA